jgi:hypothetical protein
MRTRLYNLCRNELGYDKLRPQPHVEWCDFVQGSYDVLTKPPWHNPGGLKTWNLGMIPRDHFKTTTGVVGASIDLMLHNPNITILFDAHVGENSRESLAAVKSIIESDDFIEKHGNWRKDAETSDGADAWRADAITINRRTQRGIREATITCTGIDQSKVGGHYDVIFADDLSDDKNTQSEIGREKVRRRLGQYIPLLKKGGVCCVWGTRWHLQDIYHTILAEDAARVTRGEPERFRKLIRKIWIDYGPGTGQPYFPDRFPPEVIEQLRLDCTEEEFNKWYLNNPVDDKNRVFSPSNFRFFTGDFYINGATPMLDATIVN